jgi:hypothetical protein
MALIAAAAFAAIAVPASATTVVYNGSNFGVGDPITINFAGQSSGALGTLILTLTGTSAGSHAGDTDLNFTFSLINPGTPGNTTNGNPFANIPAFGFDVSGATLDLGSSTVSTNGSPAGSIVNIGSGSISGGFSVNICGTAGPNCAGGANGGPTPGQTFNGTLAMEFTSNPDSITLSQPIIRFQNTGLNQGSDVGLPSRTPPLPEPATWAMMIMGFGATGVAMRRSRRRKKTLLPQIA